MTEAILSFFSGLSEYPIVRMRMLTDGGQSWLYCDAPIHT